MRFLADMGISVRTVGALTELGHDAVHAREIGISRATDTTILERARSQGRVVLTVDLDFGQLLAASRQITRVSLSFGCVTRRQLRSRLASFAC